ncbi:DUF4880 domain-containing protein [Steroidobacter sp. S1-65]|uniref:DUF4880 domain-containing protein n=1 Tax=Steroidobacter gossypii TaxID=2805490 RepID=A0ABS1WZE8_9GAMM|nr:DUF4880 domain-containing protein [Steroidobacter gossypii]MBM0106355.1 DUF4880 domain-containing protein [Steroidobacter gossypii]
MPFADSNGTAALERQAQAWVLRIKSGEATPSDLQALRDWCALSALHAQAFDRARCSWDEIGQVGRVFRASHPQPERIDLPTRRMFLGGALATAGAAAVAAAAVPPFGLWPSLIELNADYRTATGEQLRIELAGRIQVHLNTQSSMNVRPGGNAGDEVELLAGEAAIDSGTRPLQIVAGKGRMLLSSGGIEVRFLNDRVCVTCLRDSVEIQHPAGALVLLARQQVQYRDHEIAAMSKIDTSVTSAWRAGMVTFRDTPLPDVVAEINRYRPGRVVLLGERLDTRKVSGQFHIARLDQAIDRIEEAFGATVRRLPGDVVLLS